jgi:MFS family permease
MIYKKKLASNILKLGIIQALRWCMLIMPVVVVFYTENGLSMRAVMVLQALYSLTLLLCEVPSGYFSDTLGRRNCLVLGTALGAAGFAAYSISYGFYGFLAAEICLGIGQSFISGTDSALLYDTLLELKQEQLYIKKQGLLLAVGNFSEAAAGIAGGLIAVVSLRLPFYIETALMLGAVVTACTIREPAIHRSVKTRMTLAGLSSIVRDTFADRRLRWLIVHTALLGAATLTMVWFVQPYLQLAGVPLALFGFVWTLLHITVGVSSIAAHHTVHVLGIRLFFGVPLVLAGGAYICLGTVTALWGCLFLFVFYIVRGSIFPVFAGCINRLVPTQQRATVLSIRVMLTRLFFCVIGPLAGWLSDAVSLPSALSVTGCIFLCLGTISFAALLQAGVPPPVQHSPERV